MANEKSAPKELKVTDRRIFTPEGEIRDEFKQEIRPSDPAAQAASPAETPADPSAAPQPAAAPAAERPAPQASPRFTSLVDQLFMQGAMYLGMAPAGYPQQVKTNPAAAREIIEILVALQEKTEGNLTTEETEFLKSAISELKLAYVQRTKNI